MRKIEKAWSILLCNDDVLDAVWAAVSYLRLLAHAILHTYVELLAKGTAAELDVTSQGVRVETTVNKTTTEGVRDRRCTSGESPEV